MLDCITAICSLLDNARLALLRKIASIFLLLVYAALVSGITVALIDVSLISQSFGVEQLWLENPLQENNSRIKSTILTCLLWNIWKCRNAKVFRQEDEPNAVIAKRCREDLILWSNRCSSPSERIKIAEWSSVFPLE